jgi:hypothetical protein
MSSIVHAVAGVLPSCPIDVEAALRSMTGAEDAARALVAVDTSYLVCNARGRVGAFKSKLLVRKLSDFMFRIECEANLSFHLTLKLRSGRRSGTAHGRCGDFSSGATGERTQRADFKVSVRRTTVRIDDLNNPAFWLEVDV